MVYPIHVGIFALLLLAQAGTGFWLIRRHKKKQNSRPPLDLALVRQPGESLRIQAEELLEKMLDQIVIGSLAAMFVLGAVPWAVKKFFPQADWLSLLVGTFASVAAVSVWFLLRVRSFGLKRANVRLGMAGERDVAGHLQALTAKGYQVFHDVPMAHENGLENIDHLAVGQHGIVVVETKTRSIPTDRPPGRLEVSFDGTRLKWPRFEDDQKTVRQVERCARWVARRVRETFQLDVPVYQIIAIPGWQVLPGKSLNPRVINPGAIALAFETMTDDKPCALKAPQIKSISNHFEELCRHTHW
ncbi:MAG TPA: nuclease-related domain-containing protein [Prosthecobacter sp.]